MTIINILFLLIFFNFGFSTKIEFRIRGGSEDPSNVQETTHIGV